MKSLDEKLDDLRTELTGLISNGFNNFSAIKSIQKFGGTCYTSSSQTTTRDFTINAVNIDKSLLLISTAYGASASGGSASSVTTSHWYLSAAFLNSTTVRLTGNTSSSLTVQVNVIEFR